MYGYKVPFGTFYLTKKPALSWLIEKQINKNPVNTGDNSKMVPEAGLEPARGLNLAGF